MRPGPLPELPLRAIVVGERHRQDLGDLSALTASIAERGLLHPIVVRPDGQLVPDGTYKVVIEVPEDEIRPGAWAAVEFTKGAAPQTVMAPNMPPFTGLVIKYQP